MDVANAAPHGQSGQEFTGWILHGARRQQHGHDWEMAEAGAPGIATAAKPHRSKIAYNFGTFFFEKRFSSVSFPPFARHAIGEIAAQDRAGRRHDCVVDPRFATVSGQHDGD